MGIAEREKPQEIPEPAPEPTLEPSEPKPLDEFQEILVDFQEGIELFLTNLNNFMKKSL